MLPGAFLLGTPLQGSMMAEIGTSQPPKKRVDTTLGRVPEGPVHAFCLEANSSSFPLAGSAAVNHGTCCWDLLLGFGMLRSTP